MITVLAGGVGAARFLSGLIPVAGAASVTAVVNTGDDVILHGLRVCPDLDTVTYTLAGAVELETGWGLAEETWNAMAVLERYRRAAPSGSAAGLTWFRLGDRDLATHLYRTGRLAEGAGLAAVTGELASAWGIEATLLPMTEDDVHTRVTVEGDGEIGFQEYFVERRHDVAVSAVRFDGIGDARPGPGVLTALADADGIVIAPSNPIVSIGPVLAVAGVVDRLQSRREEVVAISPIVAGVALKGPADRLMAELGHEPSVVGVARLWSEVAATLVVDDADAALAPAVEAAGMRCVVAPSVMHGAAEAAALARAALGALG